MMAARQSELQHGSGAHALLAALRERGIRHLFGVPGHGAYPLYNALIDIPEITPVVGRHEQGVAFAADGYAWFTGQPAVLTSVPAAGFSNSLTSLLEATASQNRLLYIVEAHPLHERLIPASARYHLRIESPDEVTPAVHDLLDRLESSRPGVAVLEAATGALVQAPSEAPDVEAQPPRVRATAAEPLEQARLALVAASRVAICTGATAAAANIGPQLQRLATKLRAPVFTDALSKGIIPENDPLSLGRLWTLRGPGEKLLTDADVVIVVGAPLAAYDALDRWDPRLVTGSRSEGQLQRQLVLIDWDDAAHGSIPARARLYGAVGEILSRLEDIAQECKPTGFEPERLDEIRKLGWSDLERRSPWAVDFYRALCRQVPPETVVLADSIIGIWIDFLYPSAGRLVRTAAGTGTLGYALPAAVGVKLAEPDQK